MVSPLRWRDGVLELLDQTRLPGEEVWLRCQTPDDVAGAIRRLAVRGAPAIGIAAAYGLALAEPTPEAVEEAARLLGDTRPTAVNLGWALERGRRAFDEGGHDALLPLARRVEEEQIEADRSIAEHAAVLFGARERVLTHCNTGALATGGHGTALGAIEAAWRADAVELVWVDETRPLLQGARLTTYELGRAGIPYRLVADASAGTLMARGLVDRVIVGADRIAANGDVANKIGTYTVAVLAARHEVPFHVAAPLSTLDPDTPSGEDIAIEERDPDEVTRVGSARIAPAGAEAANWAFDVTPAELVTSIVTEAGVLEKPYDRSIARALASQSPA
ncbi:MAG: S-methyl-5-thioribose-1-phosphate isomerase [Gaiellaceae bacterium]